MMTEDEDIYEANDKYEKTNKLKMLTSDYLIILVSNSCHLWQKKS